MNERNFAVMMMLLSAIAFSLMAFFVKLAGDLPAIQKTIFRSGVIMIVSGIIFIKNKYSFHDVKCYRLMLIRMIAGTLGIVINFYSYSTLVLSDADIIYRLSSIFVIVFSWIFLNEKATKFQVAMTALAFLGVGFIVKPTFSVDVFPYLIALVGSIFAGIAYTTLRAMSGKVEPLIIVFVFSTFTTVVLLPFVLLNYVSMNTMQWACLIMAGVLAAFGQYGITVAYRHAPAGEISIYNYYGVVFTTILSVLVFKQYPDWTNYLGYILIFGSSYALFKWKRKNNSRHN